jgi:peptide/nickel transport system ATP-binding protein/oligopeptide transport system ATP-binding protein
MTPDAPLLDIQNLRVGFPIAGRMAEALKGVDVTVGAGEAVGLVGESGSGKSLTALAIMRLIALPGRVLSGRIFFHGRDLLTLPAPAMRALRGREISIVFQDPMAALNPAFTIGRQLFDVILSHQNLPAREAWNEAAAAIEMVGIPARRLSQYPHEFSGGMRQRVLIAMAIACRPKLLILDEPTTALDVTTQARIVALLRRLRDELNLSLLFITHNLDLMAELCDRVCVLYGGRVVESGATDIVARAPAHPYTKKLFACIPRLDRLGHPPVAIQGAPPILGEAMDGCMFRPRCNDSLAVCGEAIPALQTFRERDVACWACEAPLHAE